MIEGKKILALIPARAGSKGIMNKNITNLAGKPLISYTIESARKSRYIDDVIVSTDGKEIEKVALEYGAEVPFLRPKELADDRAKTIDAVIHAIKELSKLGRNYDVLILLQPTQPLRDEGDIDGAIEKYLENGEEALVSISKVNDSPVLIRTIDNNGKMTKLLDANSTIRRQDMPDYYIVNGCIYINKIEDVHKETSFNDNSMYYIMEQSHSIDIDEYSDLALAEFMIHGRCNL